LLVLAASAAADELFLKDGRSFVGTVTVERDSVLIEMAYGTIRFQREHILKIEFRETPAEEYLRRRAEIASDDPFSLFHLARWAAEQDLQDQARQLCLEVLKLDPDHADAHRQLGHVRVDGRWLAFGEALELARSKLAAGQFRQLLADILPALRKIARAADDDKQQSVGELIGQAQLRAGQFANAARTYSELSAQTKPPESLRYAATADILRANADGMYVVLDPYPPTAGLLGKSTETLKPGPASLTRPLVLQAALRNRARRDIDAGRMLLQAGKTIEAADPDTARAKYAQAARSFERADAIVPRIAHSYRVEIARRKIAAIRKAADAAARKFDEAVASRLGRQEMAPKEYRSLLVQLVHQLDRVGDTLKEVLLVAKPYPRDLILEIRWAESDLRKIQQMRKELLAEIEGNA
jgi:tetratricopeptide (TPR) repeat protein